MKNLLLAATAIATFAIAGSASADATVTYNIAATNDYVFRGLSQNVGDAALQAGVDYTNGMYYAGAWASNVDFASYELDLYGGFKPTYKDFAFDLGVITYQYNDKAFNTTELKAAVSHPFYKGTVGAATYFNVDYGSTFYYEVNGSYPLTDKLSVSGAIGEQDFTGVKYSTGNIGLTYAITPAVSLDARFSDTNIPEIFKASKPRVAVVLKATF